MQFMQGGLLFILTSSRLNQTTYQLFSVYQYDTRKILAENRRLLGIHRHFPVMEISSKPSPLPEKLLNLEIQRLLVQISEQVRKTSMEKVSHSLLSRNYSRNALEQGA